MTTTTDILDGLGITYRQLDYWTTKGYVLADACNPGSGFQRTWPDDELAIAQAIGVLTGAGLTLPVAAKAARDHIEGGRGFVTIAPNVFLVLTIAPAVVEELTLAPFVVEM